MWAGVVFWFVTAESAFVRLLGADKQACPAQSGTDLVQVWTAGATPAEAGHSPSTCGCVSCCDVSGEADQGLLAAVVCLAPLLFPPLPPVLTSFPSNSSLAPHTTARQSLAPMALLSTHPCSQP